jgi:hypothetical protein
MGRTRGPCRARRALLPGGACRHERAFAQYRSRPLHLSISRPCLCVPSSSYPSSNPCHPTEIWRSRTSEQGLYRATASLSQHGRSPARIPPDASVSLFSGAGRRQRGGGGAARVAAHGPAVARRHDGTEQPAGSTMVRNWPAPQPANQEELAAGSLPPSGSLPRRPGGSRLLPHRPRHPESGRVPAAHESKCLPRRPRPCCLADACTGPAGPGRHRHGDACCGGAA